MIRDTFQNIIEQRDLRQNLSTLRKELKEPGSKHALLYHMGANTNVLVELLSNEDAKVRKNTALVMGDLGLQEYVQPLFEAYEKEEQLFVKSSYLTAMKELDYREYLGAFKERLQTLTTMEITENSKKHVAEETRILSDLIVMIEGVRTHKFVGYRQLSEFVLLTNRDHIDVTLNQLKSMRTKAFNAGVIVKTDLMEEVLAVRTYQEILFMVEGMKTCPSDVDKAAETIVNSTLMEFLKKRHNGTAPFYFRIELKNKMELDKKSQFTKRLASEIERRSGRSLINSTSNYEVELRLIENKEGSLNCLVKLYTIPEERFTYRKEVLPTSIKPTTAALVVALTKDYMKEDAQILDPFCGVGTMLIERHKAVKANTMYGIDLFAEAIEKARVNTEEAKQIIHYINRDFFDFTHEYLFDEIITNMPRAMGRKSEEEIFELYQKFFKKAKEYLYEDATIIMYSHDKDYVKQLAPRNGYQIIKEFEINRREGAYVFVIRIK